MGNLGKKYLMMYNEEVKEAMLSHPEATYMVKPEVWITFKWSEDNGGINPWQIEWYEAFDKLLDEWELELVDYITKGVDITVPAAMEENVETLYEER